MHLAADTGPGEQLNQKRGPTHLGIDNTAVVDRACFLLDLADNLCRLRDDEHQMQNKAWFALESLGNFERQKESTGRCRRTAMSGELSGEPP